MVSQISGEEEIEETGKDDKDEADVIYILDECQPKSIEKDLTEEDTRGLFPKESSSIDNKQTSEDKVSY